MLPQFVSCTVTERIAFNLFMTFLYFDYGLFEILETVTITTAINTKLSYFLSSKISFHTF